MLNVHEQSKKGFAKGDVYDKLRPRYPPEVLKNVHDTIKLGQREINIVEIGCGSGLFTRALLEQWSSSIAALKCYEPNEGMLKTFRESIDDCRVTIAEGTFSSTDVEDGWADLIVIATAFHWCQDLEATAREFSRILKKDGVVCLLWNAEDRYKAGWIKEVLDLALSMPPKDGKGPYEYQHWRDFFDIPEYKENFQPPESSTVEYTTTGTIELMKERVTTWSPIAVLSEEKRLEFLDAMVRVIEKGENLVWVDEKEGVFEIPFAVPILIIRQKEVA